MPDFRKSKYLADAVVEWVRGTDMPSAPANVYLALYSTKPTDSAGTGAVEPTTPGIWYARQAVSLGAITGTNKTQTKSTGAITFAANDTGGDVTIQGWGIYDAVSGGNLLYVSTIDNDAAYEVIKNTQQYQIQADNLTISEE